MTINDRFDELKWILMVELSSCKVTRLLREFAPGSRLLVVLAVDANGEQQVDVIDASKTRSLGIEWPMFSGQIELTRVCVYCARPGCLVDSETGETICQQCATGIEPGELEPL